jgi:hypothetical protein
MFPSPMSGMKLRIVSSPVGRLPQCPPEPRVHAHQSAYCRNVPRQQVLHPTPNKQCDSITVMYGGA